MEKIYLSQKPEIVVVALPFFLSVFVQNKKAFYWKRVIKRIKAESVSGGEPQSRGVYAQLIIVALRFSKFSAAFLKVNKTFDINLFIQTIGFHWI